jgi:transcription initiation factor IIF auxiliary subunit
MNKSRSLAYLFRIVLCLSWLGTAVLDAYAQDVYVDNTVTDVRGGTYRWTVFLVAPRHQLDTIKYVDYCLQDRPSYPNPRRRVANRKTRFALSEFGYEEFDIRVNIFFNDGTVRTIEYRLNLIDRSVPQSEDE